MMPPTTFQYPVELRSKLQIEARISHPFTNDRKNAKGLVETYLFIPRSIGINKKTYPPHLFYRDLQSKCRLKLAPTSLSGLASKTSPPIRLLRDASDELITQHDADSLYTMEVRHRLFGCLVSDTVEALLKQAREKNQHEHTAELAGYFLRHAPDLCAQLRATFAPELAPIDEYTATFARSDEHLSLVLEQASYELWSLLNKCTQAKQQAPKEPSAAIEDEPLPTSAQPVALLTQLSSFAKTQSAYRKQRKYTSIPSRKRHYEDLIYQRNTLENEMRSILYLSARHKPDSAVTRELILSIAAGIAMVFATAMAFLAHVQYENWTTTFFVILVVSYMFKDRIKAQAQNYLTHHSSRFFYQIRTVLYGVTIRRAIGHKRETMEFVKPDAIDPQIIEERNRGHRNDGSTQDETILRYKRSTDFHLSRLTRSYAGFAIDGIMDTSKFDLSRLTKKMDDAKTTVFVPDGDGACRIQGRRVYHLHAVLKSIHDGKTQYQHYCIVLNRSGIKRIVYY
jgi:hypothetical protein